MGRDILFHCSTAAERIIIRTIDLLKKILVFCSKKLKKTVFFIQCIFILFFHFILKNYENGETEQEDHAAKSSRY
jgi:hypothetical protein